MAWEKRLVIQIWSNLLKFRCESVNSIILYGYEFVSNKLFTSWCASKFSLYLSSKHVDGNQFILLLGYKFVSDNLFFSQCVCVGVYKVFISKLRESKGYSDSPLSPRCACVIAHMWTASKAFLVRWQHWGWSWKVFPGVCS